MSCCNTILMIDSSYRDRKTYPLNTSFALPINATEPNTNYIQVPLIFFKWSFPQISVVGTLIGGTITNIVLSSEFSVSLYNYYIGCFIKFYNSSSVLLESSKVLSYDPSTNSVVLDNPISINTVNSTDSIEISYFDSISFPFYIQVVGYIDGIISEYNNLYLYNRTKNLMFEIAELDRFGFIRLYETMNSSYDINDEFEIRLSSNHYKITSSEYNISVSKYMIDSSKHVNLYSIGQIVQILSTTEIIDTPQLYRVKLIEPLELELISYGGNYSLGEYYVIVPEEKSGEPSEYDNYFPIQIIETVATCHCPLVSIPSPLNNVLYLGNFRFGSLIHFSYTIFSTWIVINNMDAYTEILLDLYKDETILDVYFLPTYQTPVSFNVANSSFPTNPICFNIELVSLILPNKFVKGYHQLLSFFPYVVVKLYNMALPTKTKNYSIITNNPFTSISQFICPIGNLLNPFIIRFVEISSNMNQSLQLNPHEDMFFEVCLPDGTVLEYEENIAISSNLEYLTNYSTILQNRFDFTFYNTVCAIFSLKSL